MRLLKIEEYRHGDEVFTYKVDPKLSILNDRRISKYVYDLTGGRTCCRVTYLDHNAERQTVELIPPFRDGEVMAYEMSYSDAVSWLNSERRLTYMRLLEQSHHTKPVRAISGWEHSEKIRPSLSLYNVKVSNVTICSLTSLYDDIVDPEDVRQLFKRHAFCSHVWKYDYHVFPNVNVWNEFYPERRAIALVQSHFRRLVLDDLGLSYMPYGFDGTIKAPYGLEIEGSMEFTSEHVDGDYICLFFKDQPQCVRYPKSLIGLSDDELREHARMLFEEQKRKKNKNEPKRTRLITKHKAVKRTRKRGLPRTVYR